MIIITKGSSSGLALGPLHPGILPYFPGEGCQVPALTAVSSLSGILGWAVILQQLPAVVQPRGSTASWCGADWLRQKNHKELFDSLFPLPIAPSKCQNRRQSCNGRNTGLFFIGVNFPKGYL